MNNLPARPTTSRFWTVVQKSPLGSFRHDDFAARPPVAGRMFVPKDFASSLAPPWDFRKALGSFRNRNAEGVATIGRFPVRWSGGSGRAEWPRTARGSPGVGFVSRRDQEPGIASRPSAIARQPVEGPRRRVRRWNGRKVLACWEFPPIVGFVSQGRCDGSRTAPEDAPLGREDAGARLRGEDRDLTAFRRPLSPRIGAPAPGKGG